MHIVEAYSNHCGVKLPKSGIAPIESFYPSPEKYITIHPASRGDAKVYDYFVEVLSWIKPALDKENIKIIQVGYKTDKVISLCEDYRANTNFSQTCYLVKNSLLHIGCDSVYMHVAGLYKVPLIALFGTTLPAVSAPYYKGDKTIIIESDRGGRKASLALNEAVKTINMIKPEKVINSVFNLLNIKRGFNIETKYIGSAYHNFVIEYLPKNPIQTPLTKESILNIRLDREFNQENAANALTLFKSNLITDKPFSSDLLRFKNLNSVVYDVKSSENVDVGFVNFMHKNAIPYQIITELTDKQLSDTKLKLFDFNQVSEKRKFEALDFEGDFYFKSSRILSSGDKLHLSYWHYLNDIEHKQSKNNFSDKLPSTKDLTFWENQDSMYIYKYEII